MKFMTCAQIFHNIEQEPSRTEMTKILAQLLQACSAREAQIIAYVSMGSLFPAYKDKQFNIAIKGMVGIVALFLQQSEDVVAKKIKEAGDAGTVVFDAWLGKDEGLTLQQVYDQLVEIAEISGTGSTDKKANALVALLQNVMDPVQNALFAL